MYFRFRRYSVVSGKTEAFNDFFLRHLLPIQRRHGAKLVGRWQTEDRGEIVVLWAYDSGSPGVQAATPGPAVHVTGASIERDGRRCGDTPNRRCLPHIAAVRALP